MEIITIECPNCKGNLHLDKGTEKCFCAYCRAEVMVREVASSSGTTLDSLVKRGFLALEFAEWDRATDSFDQATLIDPEHAMIYVGKLMVELELKHERTLGQHDKELTGYINYQKAIRFADSEFKKRLEKYNEEIIEVKQKKLEEDAEKRKAELERLKREHEKITHLEGKRREENALKQRKIIFITILSMVLIGLLIIVISFLNK